MTCVVDSSATLAWLLADERNDLTTSVFRLVARNGAVVPSIWPIEVANSLNMAARRDRITHSVRDQHLSDLAQLAIEIDGDTAAHAWHATLKLADMHSLTVYDAAYLELAQRRRLPLATLDKALIGAAAKTGVKILPEISAPS